MIAYINLFKYVYTHFHICIWANIYIIDHVWVYTNTWYCFTQWVCFTPILTGVFSLKNNWDQDCRILLSIQVDLKDSVVRRVSIFLLISNSVNLFPKLLRKRVPGNLGITVTFIFHGFLSSQARSEYLYIFFDFFYFLSVICWNNKICYIICSFFFLLIITRSSVLVGINWSDCFSKSWTIFWISWTDSGFCIWIC